LKTEGHESVQIESLAYRGEGIGHIKNKVIFVPLTAPGDRVKVLISENKRNYMRGTFQEIENRSPARVVPLCNYFGECGGCHWQHIDYAHQIKAKEKIVKDTISRIGKINVDSYDFYPSIPSSKIYGYRCRIRLQCAARRRTIIGYFKGQSSEIIPINHCEIIPPFMNGILRKLDDFFNSLDYLTDFTEIELLAKPDKEEATLAFNNSFPISPMDDRLKEFLKALKTHIPKVYGVSIESPQEGESETRREYFGNCSLLFPLSFKTALRSEPVSIQAKMQIHTFGQVNLEQNDQLIKTVYEWVEPSEEKVIADLFCGMANLSLPLAGEVNKIIGIENNPLAIEDARENAELNGFDNCDFYHANALTDLDRLKEESRLDVIILDPPRKGAKECIGKIAAVKPKKIVYVSCNPTTLARDINLLTYSNYRLRRIQLLDMFPQTYHIECVAELILND